MEKKLKQIFTGIALGLALILSLGAVALAGKSWGWYEKEPKPTLEALSFEETGYGTYAVSLKDYEATEVVVPSKYNGKPVTEIVGREGLDLTMDTMNIVYETDTADEIRTLLLDFAKTMSGDSGPGEFDTSGLEKGRMGFGLATNLKKITIPESVQVIGVNAFWGCCSLIEIELPKSIKEIGSNAFKYATSLERVQLPSKLEHCGARVFSYCMSLDKINIPQTEELPEDLFYECRALEEVTVPEGVKRLSENVFRGCTGLKRVTLPETLKIIGYRSFYGCKALTVLKMPAVLESCGADVFYGCESLLEINIPQMEELPSQMFYNCKALYKVTVPDGVKKISRNAFSYCEALREIVLPETLTEIGEYAFSSCNRLYSINMPAVLEVCGAGIFFECTSLGRVNIPQMEVLPSRMFYNCKVLYKVILPEGVKTVSGSAFAGCKLLSEIVLPKTLTEIGDGAFTDCIKLATVYNLSGLELTAGADTFGGVAKYATNIYTELPAA